MIAEDMAIGPEDKIYLLGSADRSPCEANFCNSEMLVERHMPDGTLDTSFGFEGFSAPVKVVRQVGSGFRGSLAISPDGKPVIAVGDGGDITIARFGTNGRLDPGFGLGGRTTVDFGAYESGPKIAIAPDGKVVLAAGSEIRFSYGLGSTRQYLGLARLDQDGSLDPSFGGLGGGGGPGWTLELAGFGPGGIALFGSGRIAVGGPPCCGVSTSKFARVGRRLEYGLVPDGSDRPWSSVKVGPNTEVSEIFALSGGRIEFVGMSRRGAFVARVLPSGRLDRRFGRAGIVRMGLIASLGQAPVAAIDRQGRLLVAGPRRVRLASDFDGVPFEPVLLRRRLSGGSDNPFGIGGTVEIRVNGRIPVALGVQSKSRIVLFSEGSTQCLRSCEAAVPWLQAFVGGLHRPHCLGRRATIVGTQGADRIVGTSRRDVIAGLSGDDVIYGRGGDDLICGGGGRDRIYGGPGRDHVRY